PAEAPSPLPAIIARGEAGLPSEELREMTGSGVVRAAAITLRRPSPRTAGRRGRSRGRVGRLWAGTQARGDRPAPSLARRHRHPPTPPSASPLPILRNQATARCPTRLAPPSSAHSG